MTWSIIFIRYIPEATEAVEFKACERERSLMCSLMCSTKYNTRDHVKYTLAIFRCHSESRLSISPSKPVVSPKKPQT